MVSFLVSAAVNALILSFVPWVKHKGYGSCFAVAVVMALVIRVLAIFAIPFLVGIGILSVIPVAGWLLAPILVFLLVLMIGALSLRIADAVIDGFEIRTFGDTVLTALVLALANGVLHGLVS